MAARARGRVAVVFVGLIASLEPARDRRRRGAVIAALAGWHLGSRRAARHERRPRPRTWRRPRAPAPGRAGWWGMVLLIATEATLFLLLLASYFYLRVETIGPVAARAASPTQAAPAAARHAPPCRSSVAVVLAGRAVRAGAGRPPRVCLARGAPARHAASSCFQGILVNDSLDGFRPSEDAYASIYYTLIGVHYAHVVVGRCSPGWALVRSPRFTPERHLTLQVTALYVHFVNVVAVVVFPTLYLAPRG